MKHKEPYHSHKVIRNEQTGKEKGLLEILQEEQTKLEWRRTYRPSDVILTSAEGMRLFEEAIKKRQEYEKTASKENQ